MISSRSYALLWCIYVKPTVRIQIFSRPHVTCKLIKRFRQCCTSWPYCRSINPIKPPVGYGASLSVVFSLEILIKRLIGEPNLSRSNSYSVITIPNYISKAWCGHPAYVYACMCVCDLFIFVDFFCAHILGNRALSGDNLFNLRSLSNR